MNLLRRLYLPLLVVLASTLGASARRLITADVEVDASALALADAERADGLRDYIRRLAESYAPDVRLAMTPIRPAELVIYLRLTEATADRYLADLTLTAYRPVYGREGRSPLLVAAERALPLERRATDGFLPVPGTLPEGTFGRRLYYYLTLSMMLYYDSFDTLGGAPFAEHLRRLSDRLSTAGSSDEPTADAPLAPERLLPEVETPEGTRLRELWCLYHREVLDEPQAPRARQSLLYFLREMTALRRSMHTPRLLQLVCETKQDELAPRRTDPEMGPLLEELIPWL